MAYAGSFTRGSEDVFIALMGVTGAGKSTFISHCTDEQVEVGHNLQSCTQLVKVYNCSLIPGVNVKLVDTPGFDDSSRSDTEVLREIASWLTASYSSKIQLRGIIYLHRISDRRVPGSAKRNLIMFKKLCGPAALRNVILATTMWEAVNIKEGAAREKELSETEDFWGYMIQQGSRLERHTNDRESAMRLVSAFAAQASGAKNFVLEAQREMVDQRKTLSQTAAGMSLEGELAKERAKWQREIKALKKEMEEAVKEKDEESTRELRREKQRMDRELQRISQQQEDLQSSLEQRHQEKVRELQQVIQRQLDQANALQARQQQMLADERAARELQETEHKREMERIRKRFEATQLQASRPQSSRSDSGTRQMQVVPSGSSASEASSSRAVVPSTSIPQVLPTPMVSETKQSPSRKSDEVRSLSIVGKHCFFGGSMGFSSRGTQALREKVNDGAKQRLCVAFGTNDTWFCRYNEDKRNVNYHRLTESYDTLKEWIEEGSRYKMPVCISLGPRGSHFMHDGQGYTKWNADKDTREHMERGAKVEYMWFGKDGAYVGTRRDGTFFWNLRGNYKNLERVLSNWKMRPTAIAMNLENGEEYFGVWPQGCYSFCLLKGGEIEERVRSFLDQHGFL